MKEGIESRVRSLAKSIRIHSLKMTSSGNSSHIASALSMADILAVLYGEVLNIDPENPTSPDRDRFILSKGHAGAIVYAVLAEQGFFPVKELNTHYQDGSRLSGHVSHKGIPGVEVSTGSLGHGLSIGAGMALDAKLRKRGHRIFVLLSDGECDEGSNWEAILFAGHHKLSNLTVIIDYNKYQALSSVSDVLDIDPLGEKLTCFGWRVHETDGHSYRDLIDVFNTASSETEKPTAIIAHTVKGKGVSFMEEDPVLWHYRPARDDKFEIALEELMAGI